MSQKSVPFSFELKWHREEEDTGDFPFKKLQAEAAKLDPPLLDYASYIGPIAMRASKGKARGMFLTRAVKAGELLICDKAFSAGFVPKDQRNAAEWTLIRNPPTTERWLAGHAIMLSKPIQKLHLNTSLAREFMKLHCGDTASDEASLSLGTVEVLDTYAILRAHRVF